MRRVDSPTALPGSCGVCGSGSREYYIDTGLNFEFHGAFFICNLCLDAMAGMCDLASRETVTAMKEQIEALKAEVYELSRQRDGLEQAVDGLTFAGARDRAHSGWGLPLSPPMDDTAAHSGEDSVGSREEGPSESSDDEGVAELSNADHSADFSII